jgi:7-cyano-7-deazaguanine tRNA-ribosyltransferase
MDRISLGSYVLVSENPVKNNDEFDNVLLFKPPFGPYPQELMETYPFNAEVPDETDERAIEIAASNLDRLMAANPKSKFTLRLSEKYKGKIDRIPRQASAEIHSAL